MAIGNRLKTRRNELGLTLENLAQRVGVSRQTIQRYESGVIENIPPDKIETLAKALRTTPSYLMGWDIDLKDGHAVMGGKLLEIIPNMSIHINDDISEHKLVFDDGATIPIDDNELAELAEKTKEQVKLYLLELRYKKQEE
jgi:transcriptional regulator with XRE-family HTH domain